MILQTLSCGQAFRWFEREGWYYVHHRFRLFRARTPADLRSTEARRFFALDHPLSSIRASLPQDRILRQAMGAWDGIRILRQDPWEMLLSFVTSACSNIPRITRDLNTLARRYGRPVRLGPVKGHALPAPGTSLPEGPLRRARFGYRAAYLSALSRQVTRPMLRRIGALPTPDAREALCRLPGVGSKVADCILLFAYGRLEVFPVDTRIRQLMIRHYFGGRRTPDRALIAFAMDHFGRYAGYAQQYLYAWSRRIPEAAA